MNVSLGNDPEFFFRDKKTHEVVGAEHVLPSEVNIFEVGNVIVDGVACELQPKAWSECREVAFALDTILITEAAVFADKAGCYISFDTEIELSPEQFESLSDKNKVLGCQPSENAYGKSPIPAMAKISRKRYGGGHIHMGYLDKEYGNDVLPKMKVKKLVKALDVVVGNTCVMFDQYKGSKERRESYGRAGEYRVKPYGLEYRTLSNFWLRDYYLYGLAFGLVKNVFKLAEYRGESAIDELLSLVKQKDIVQAINTNDAKLARKNFDKYHQFFVDHSMGNDLPLDIECKDSLIKFLDSGDTVPERPFKENYDRGYKMGFETFLRDNY